MKRDRGLISPQGFRALSPEGLCAARIYHLRGTDDSTKVRDVDYPSLAKALPDADYTFEGTKGRGRTWSHPSGDQFTVRDMGPGKPMWGDEIDKVARHLRAVTESGGSSNGDDDGPAQGPG